MDKHERKWRGDADFFREHASLQREDGNKREAARYAKIARRADRVATRQEQPQPKSWWKR